jgi:CO/xanthine dehydrogenase Mo-binding subunit
MGGAFGGRTLPTAELEAARLARSVAPRPVLVQWTRADEFREAFHRPPATHRIRARLGPDGRVAARWHAFVCGHLIRSGAVLPAWLQRAANAVTGDSGIARGARPPHAPGATRVEFDALPPGRALGIGCAPYEDASWTAVVAEVEADARGGFAARGLWCAQDSGRVLDADRVRAQVEGNLVWAIGSALREELLTEAGAVTAASFADDRLPSLADVPPRLEVALLEPPPGAGFSGAGETALGRAAQVRHARAPLAGGQDPLPAVGLVCGFPDQSHVTREFRKRVNMMPGAYRALARKTGGGRAS